MDSSLFHFVPAIRTERVSTRTIKITVVPVLMEVEDGGTTHVTLSV